MKKTFIGIITLLLVGCTNIQVPNNTVCKQSSLVDVKVPQLEGNKLQLQLTNKTQGCVEVLLQESTINNCWVYDAEEIERVLTQNAIASLANAANGLNCAAGDYSAQRLDSTQQQLTNKSANVVLLPGETVEKVVGNQVSYTHDYPIKVVIKCKQGNTVDYSCVTLTK